MTESLTERQKEVLKNVVQTFILTAAPVGSRGLSKKRNLSLSPATIRNVMADLEDQGYISHPHVSAGRIPTDKGYRFYVDGLMGIEMLSQKDKDGIYQNLSGITETEDLLKEASKLLSRISKQLSIVSTPHLRTGVLTQLEIIQISNSKLMVIMSIRSGLVKTITMEVTFEISRSKIEEISRFLNERLCGLTLNEIRETFHDRVKDAENEDTGLIRLFLCNTDKLFNDFYSRERLHISGTTNILSQPEFESPEHIKSIIELIDNEDIIIHVLEKFEEKNKCDNVTIMIGSENDIERLQDYSLIISSYRIGETTGTIGIIGPTRMEYSKVIPIVSCVAEAVSSNN
jgi:heat-inducible transcriptional repressor